MRHDGKRIAERAIDAMKRAAAELGDDMEKLGAREQRQIYFDAIRAEFAKPAGPWQVVETKSGNYRIKNAETGAYVPRSSFQYRAKAEERAKWMNDNV